MTTVVPTSPVVALAVEPGGCVCVCEGGGKQTVHDAIHLTVQVPVPSLPPARPPTPISIDC